MSDRKISGVQLIGIGVCNLMGTILISAYISSVLEHEAWLAGVFGFAASLPELFIYCALTKKYPGMGLFQINEAVFGAVAGKIMSALYVLFFFTLCAQGVMEATNFLLFLIFPDASRLLIAALLVACCVYGAKKGILPAARVSTIFLLIMCVVMLAYVVLSLVDARFDRLLPLFSHKPADYLRATHIAAAFPFGEMVLLMTLVPDLDKKVNVKRTYFSVAGAAAFIMVLIHVREITVLGSMSAFSTLPTYEAARLVHIPGVLTRIESLFALALIMLNLFKTIVVFYILANGIKQIVRVPRRGYLTALGVLLTACAVTFFASPARNLTLGVNYAPYVWSFFTFALPLITLLAAVAKAVAARLHSRTEIKKMTQ